jgi:acyl-CoA hydrolase
MTARVGLATAADALGAFAPGARVFVPGLAGEPAWLGEALRARPEAARGVTFCVVQLPGVDRVDLLGSHPEARLVAFFMTPAVRRGLADGRAALRPLDYLGIARALHAADPFDAVVAQLTPPDADGWCSTGLSADFLPLVWPRARRRIAHLHPRLPRTRARFRVHVSSIDTIVDGDAPLVEHQEAPAGEVERRIGAHVAALVRDGDVLQFGIGGVPLAAAHALAAHRRLRLHGGLAGNGLVTLWEAGALDRDARHVTGVLLGDRALHALARELPSLWLDDVRRTHHPAAIAAAARGARFVAINGAVEVDLFGQVDAERSAGRVHAGAGGLPAFAQAALQIEGARLVIVLPSTARDGSVSRIVPALGADSLVTLPRHLADTVVTEHGVAAIRELGLDARAEALIAIAAPAQRDGLADAWSRLRARL